jgi:hypothetical protein
MWFRVAAGLRLVGVAITDLWAHVHCIGKDCTYGLGLSGALATLSVVQVDATAGQPHRIQYLV